MWYALCCAFILITAGVSESFFNNLLQNKLSSSESLVINMN